LRLPVTEAGVIIPKELFGDAVEVTVRREQDRILLRPVQNTEPAPSAGTSLGSIWDLGSQPIKDDPITDSSVNHDRYLYGQDQ
jgi:hypothetical protein